MDHETHDYIIVGAGSAGCVLANRLSENPHVSVLLIEAGGSDRRFWIRTPLGYALTYSDPRVNWCYTAEADPGLNGRPAFFPRGKVLGGSSSINAMAYVRGLPRDFDDWQAAGAAGWSWSEVRPVFDALECHDEVSGPGNRRTRGTGPVRVCDLRDRFHPFAGNFLGAARDLGWPVLEHLNGDETEGLGMMRSTVRDGRRWSSADAFLHPARRRPNLRVVTGALVERLRLDGRRITGLTYRRGERRITAGARREVILSAGAINSPKILQLSGIGDPALLSDLGIETRHALPEVGNGLQDHLAVSHFFRTDRETLNRVLGSHLGRLAAGLRYVLTRSGPLSVPVNHCSGFVRGEDDSPGPDVQIYCNPASYSVTATGRTQMDPWDGYLLCAQPCRPTSRGRVSIASPDPSAPPRIQPNSLSSNEDCRQAVRAGRVLQRLARTPTLAGLTTARKAPDLLDMDDAALLEDFRARAGSVFHASCTCRMGHDATDSVLDSRLRVHGLSGLRVVDASAFPNVTSGNTNAPTMMLAARADNLIVQDMTA